MSKGPQLIYDATEKGVSRLLLYSAIVSCAAYFVLICVFIFHLCIIVYMPVTRRHATYTQACPTSDIIGLRRASVRMPSQW